MCAWGARVRGAYRAASLRRPHEDLCRPGRNGEQLASRIPRRGAHPTLMHEHRVQEELLAVPHPQRARHIVVARREESAAVRPREQTDAHLWVGYVRVGPHGRNGERQPLGDIPAGGGIVGRLEPDHGILREGLAHLSWVSALGDALPRQRVEQPRTLVVRSKREQMAMRMPRDSLDAERVLVRSEGLQVLAGRRVQQHLIL